MRTIHVLVVCLVVGLWFVPEAGAKDGMVNAVLLRPIPIEKSIAVLPLDNSDENLILQSIIENELAKAGYKIDANASTILSFSRRDQIGGWDSGTKGHVFSFETKVSRAGEENNRARINVFDSATGGLLNRQQGNPQASSTPSQYRLEISIEDRHTGKAYWRAWSVADLDMGDGFELTKKMIPPLIQGVGKTVRQRPFRID